MKKEIHPDFGESKISCACGSVLKTKSTVKDMHVNICASCHPFYTGKAKFIDTEGRIEKFRKRYATPAKS